MHRAILVNKNKAGLQRMNKSKISKGKEIERLIAQKLQALKYKIIKLNFHSYFGEIDIIAIHENVLVFIEVKARSSSQYGQPFQAVTNSKLEKIIKTGQHFKNTWEKSKLPKAERIDVVSVKINKQNQIEEWNIIKNVTR